MPFFESVSRYIFFISVLFFLSFFLQDSVFAQQDQNAIKGKRVSVIQVGTQEDVRQVKLVDFNLDEGDDSDTDGLSDLLEISLGTDLQNIDPDNDGYEDKEELLHHYDPLQGNNTKLPFDESFIQKKKGSLLLENTSQGPVGWYIDQDTANLYFLGVFKDIRDTLKKFGLSYHPSDNDNQVSQKRIEVDLSRQRLIFFIKDIKLGEMIVSTGTDRLPTPTGTFHILNKTPRAWSKLAKLWMPKWMGFALGGKVGIHELPEWPGGKKEGANHLGKRVSHGCIRLGVKDAQFLYDWTPIGTKVVVKK